MTIKFSSTTLATLLPLLLFGCHQNVSNDQSRPIRTFQPPSATEAFNLQSQCTSLGQKILENNMIGTALRQEQVSHYNAADNRCYVRLTVSTADLTTPRDRLLIDEFLYDGQTGDLLASLNYKGEQGYGHIFGDALRKMVKNPLAPSAEEVSDIMEKFLSTDRKP